MAKQNKGTGAIKFPDSVRVHLTQINLISYSYGGENKAEREKVAVGTLAKAGEP